MKLTAIFTAAVASLSTLVSAQTATVKNECPFTVYVQSFPYNGGPANAFTVIKKGGVPYVEKYINGGSTIKMSRSRDLASPLFFGYTYQSGNSNIYYSLDSKFGNPFINYTNKLVPNKPSCLRFNCGAGRTGCYGATYSCTNPVDLTTTLCKGASS